MMELIKWLGSNVDGNDYMTMIGCGLNDKPVIYGIGIACLGIVILYGIVAHHNWKIARQYKESNTRYYLLYFTYVFIFCALSGYGYRIMSIWWNPYKLLLGMLIVLNVMTLLFIKYMKRSRAVEKIYEAEMSIQSKLNELEVKIEKRTLSSFNNDGKTIPYKDLKALHEGQWYDLNDGVRYMPIDLSGDILHYRTEIKEGWYFGSHNHDCYERCIVRSGTLLVNEKAYNHGDYADNEPFQFHNAGAIVVTNIDVYFSMNKFSDGGYKKG